MRPLRMATRPILIYGSIAVCSLAFLTWLVGAIGHAREEARSAQCVCNLKQLGLAPLNYESAYRCLPPAYVADPHGKPLYSWRVVLMAYLERAAGWKDRQLTERFRFDESWDSPANRKLHDPARPVMSARERRPITLFDLMILAAATAIGLSLVQFGWPRKVAGAWIFTWPVLPSNAGGYPSKTWVLPIAERAAPFLPCLAAWTGAFLVTRLRSPRPCRRRLLRQPGLVAAVAALSILTIEWLLLIGSAKLDGRFNWSSRSSINAFVANSVILLAHHAGWAVVVSWLTLVLIGQWHPERTWIDRWGRVLGCTWIIVGPVASLLIDHTPWWGYFISGRTSTTVVTLFLV